MAQYHLYLALTVGLLFVVLGLTGSLNVFHVELDEWLNPKLTIENPQFFNALCAAHYLFRLWRQSRLERRAI